MGIIFIKYYTVFILVLSLCFLFGHVMFLILNIEFKNNYVALFSKVFLSVSVFSICSAILFTNGRTIMTGLLLLSLLLLFVYYKNRYHIKNHIKTNYNGVLFKNVIILFVGATLLFLFRVYQIYNLDGSIPLTPHGDIIYYANLIDFLLRFGYENSSIDTIYPQGVSPYHYYDIWFGAGIVYLLNLNTALVLELIVYTIGPFLIWLGVISAYSHLKSIKYIDILFSFFGVIAIGIYFNCYTHIAFMNNIGVYATNSLNYNKLFPIYLFALAFLNFYFCKRYVEAIICAVCIPFVFISAAIGIFSGLFLYLLYSKAFLKRKIILEMIILLFSALFIYLFYKLQPAIETHVSTNFSSMFQEILKPSYLKTIVNIFGGTTIQFGLIFSAYILLYILNNKPEDIFKSYFELILLAVLIYVITLLAWGVLHNYTSIVQVFSNISVVVFNLLATFIVLDVVKQEKFKKPINVILMIFIVCSCIMITKNNLATRFLYSYDNKYLEEIEQSSGSLNKNGAFIYTVKDYKNSRFSYIANFAKPGSYLIYSQNKTFPLSISPFSYPLSDDDDIRERELASLKTTPFWKYVEHQKQMHTFKCIPESQAEFIKKYNINYLICTKEVVLPPQLSDKIKKEIIDMNTGERFYLLK